MSAIRRPKFISNFRYFIKESRMIFLFDNFLQIKSTNIPLDLNIEILIVLRRATVYLVALVPVRLDVGDVIVTGLALEVCAKTG